MVIPGFGFQIKGGWGGREEEEGKLRKDQYEAHPYPLPIRMLPCSWERCPESDAGE